jgi:hypothetical protein
VAPRAKTVLEIQTGGSSLKGVDVSEEEAMFVSRLGKVARLAAVGGAAAVAVLALTAGAASAAVPASPWYWSLVVPSPGTNVLVLGTGHGLFRSSNGGKTWKAVGPKGLDSTSLVK